MGQVRIWRSSGHGRGYKNQNGRKSLFPQCKTSIDKNSGSMKQSRAVKFVCSMGFVAATDRLVWPPSLSRDWKWTRVTKCTHSRVVGLRLVLYGNLVTIRFVRTGRIGWYCVVISWYSLLQCSMIIDVCKNVPTSIVLYCKRGTAAYKYISFLLDLENFGSLCGCLHSLIAFLLSTVKCR